MGALGRGAPLMRQAFILSRGAAGAAALHLMQPCVVSEAAMAVMMVTKRLRRVFHFSLVMAVGC